MDTTNAFSNLPLLTFLDVEASGLQKPDSFPIEIGWADTLGNSDEFLIYPIDTWFHWDKQAEALHGITHTQLLEAGISVIDAACRLNDMLGVERVYCDALSFDGFWLDRLFKAAGMAPSFLLTDVFELYGALGAELAEEMVRKLREIPATHRALEDAERYAAAYREVMAGYLMQQTKVE
ncbi:MULTISPECIES: exonuclease domain-containing protein [unclassified Halomonas]|uniref:3'-5' exonuclease n=1 Tax=unclassified Halomonas TaxID=2609666 RepID=UPI0028862540|nr:MULTISPECIES: exonuclease domain-containing protein [unclassified Halomonas]MDT0501753.1 hypothetical protein [Halomonas sp. PAR7]MDT0513417.1 hypothetical protein [Halomonas sp. LES1]MDT0591816.1 hypothetical protein [Halomonas sp. PAR8]